MRVREITNINKPLKNLFFIQFFSQKGRISFLHVCQRLSELLIFTLLTGCALNKPDYRQNADNLATIGNFRKNWIKTKDFHFLTYQKINDRSQPLHLYIEGDGKSYLTRTQVSPDPTPQNPLALKLALLDSHPNVVYLARPCQYTEPGLDKACVDAIWTHLRFSEPVIMAMNEAVSNIVQQNFSDHREFEKLSKAKKQNKAEKQITLIGFSGGAAIATLLAARRTDIQKLITVAGDLDHQRMSEFHNTTPLDSACLNPKDYAKKLAQLPQHHLAGEKDTIVPAFISEEFVNDALSALRGKNRIKRTLVKNTTHHEGWEQMWPELIKQCQEN